MDRRFFENDNIEDLTNNEGPENFQKIEEEEEVLRKIIYGVMKKRIFHQMKF